jgi:hypothetical protein
MDNTMLIAILLYTEASPIKIMNDKAALDVFTEIAAYRYWQRCFTYGGCKVTDNGTVLQEGLRRFLAWSSTFTNYSYGISETSPIVTGQYGSPTWAYKMAKDIVLPKKPDWLIWNKDKPQSAMNPQSLEEEEHFRGAYTNKFDTSPNGVYYMWPEEWYGQVGSWTVLTANQEENHCGLHHEIYQCGN